MKSLKNEKGFTLIELVLVIVVLGILGAVATIQFGSLVKDANGAALDAAPASYNAQIAMAVNTLKKVPNCTAAEFGAEVFNKVSMSGGKVTPSKTDCGATPGTTVVTFTISATCKDVWNYADATGSFSKDAVASNRAGC